jgi:hypothetical protein
MVNAPNKNLSPLLAGKHGQSNIQSARSYHSVKKVKPGLEVKNDLSFASIAQLTIQKQAFSGEN